MEPNPGLAQGLENSHTPLEREPEHPLFDFGKLRTVLDQRVKDGVLRRSIDEWLRAGVMEDDRVTSSTQGTPQGGVISPLLANIFLHEVMDKWFNNEVRTRVPGAVMFRFADDTILAFNSKQDAEKVLRVTRKRFEKFGLALHPEKTRLIDFRKPSRYRRPDGSSSPGTIGFLGFDLYWSISRKKTWCLKKKTRAKKIRASLAEIAKWCREHRHQKVAWQHLKLSEKIRGHYAYFAVSCNK